MSDYIITGEENDFMYDWVEKHNKTCIYANTPHGERFTIANENIISYDLCVVRVTCKCGEVKVVTVCGKV